MEITVIALLTSGEEGDTGMPLLRRRMSFDVTDVRFFYEGSQEGTINIFFGEITGVLIEYNFKKFDSLWKRARAENIWITPFTKN
jgi:hypothetical protein